MVLLFCPFAFGLELGDGVVPTVGVVMGVLVGVTPMVGVAVGLTGVGVGVDEDTVGVIGAGVALTGVGKTPPWPVGTVGVTPGGTVAVAVAFFPKGPASRMIGIFAI